MGYYKIVYVNGVSEIVDITDDFTSFELYRKNGNIYIKIDDVRVIDIKHIDNLSIYWYEECINIDINKEVKELKDHMVYTIA